MIAVLKDASFNTSTENWSLKCKGTEDGAWITGAQMDPICIMSEVSQNCPLPYLEPV